MAIVIRLLRTLFSLYSLCLIARTFLQLFLGSFHPVVSFLVTITEPVLKPIRRYIPPVQAGSAAWDLAPMVALILLWIVERVLVLILVSL